MITSRQRQAVIKTATAMKFSDTKIVNVEDSNQIRLVMTGVYDMIRKGVRRPYVTIVFVNKELPEKRITWDLSNENGKITMKLNGKSIRSLFDTTNYIIARTGVQ